ncbi:MAG: hypothetical protein WCA20_28965 [Candidatus Sulfotelmatobacter sp.]
MLQAMYVLRSAGYDEKAVSEFFRPFDRERYSRCMAETLDAVRDFQLAAVAFDEALSGDLDVIGAEERILERDHPAWRFKRIVEGMQGIGPLGRGRAISNDDLERASERVKMPSSTVIVGRVLAESKDIDGVLGRPSEANISKQLVDAGQVISLNTDFIQRRALGQLLACLRRRSVDPFRTIQPIPLLVLFQDDLSATAMSEQGGGLSREQFMIGLGDIALSLATWILFLDPYGNAGSITKFQKSCERFYGNFSMDFLNRARIADEKGDFEGVIPYLAMIPQHFLQAAIAGKLYALLRWN